MRRPASMSPDAVPLTLWVDVRKNSVILKFFGGYGIRLPRDNPDYYAVIGRWLAGAIEAEATAFRPTPGEAQLPATAEGRDALLEAKVNRLFDERPAPEGQIT